MTVGERIQQLRKSQALSQDDLGQRLMVSRQTISLWENNQTLPTIDNLVRLKEIFGVSLDTLLCGDRDMDDAELPAREQYEMTYSSAELKNIEDAMLSKARHKRLPYVAAFVLLTIRLTLAGDFGFPQGLFWGATIAIVVWNVRALRQYRTVWCKASEGMRDSQYIFCVYEGFVRLKIKGDGRVWSSRDIPFSEIENVQCAADFWLFESRNQRYMIRMSSVPETSMLYNILTSPDTQKKDNPKWDKWKILSMVLFVAALLSLRWGLQAVAALSGKNHMFTENMWVFLLFLPIPISSVVLGFVLKRRGYKWKKNVIAGFIIAVLLILYGCFTFIFSGIHDYSDSFLKTVQNYTQLTIPSYTYISTTDWSKLTQPSEQEHIYFTSEIVLDAKEAGEYESAIASDFRWVRGIRSDLFCLLSDWNAAMPKDYILLFNISENTFNELPSQSGTYRFLCVAYDDETHMIYASEYDIVYEE